MAIPEPALCLNNRVKATGGSKISGENALGKPSGSGGNVGRIGNPAIMAAIGFRPVVLRRRFSAALPFHFWCN
jgi:hypothetical protein